MEKTSDQKPEYPDLDEQVTVESMRWRMERIGGTRWDVQHTTLSVARSTHDPIAFSPTSTLLCPGNAGIATFPFLLLCKHIMMRSLISSLLIAAVMAVTVKAAASAAAAEEEFREELTLRPLRDGTVAAHFSFSTLLRGAVPRAPNSLGIDDTCTHISP